MADGGVGEAAIISAVIGAGATAYAVSQQPKAPKIPGIPAAPLLPTKPAMLPGANQADAAARSAGGTLLAKAKEQQIADGGGVRKSLLGQ